MSLRENAHMAAPGMLAAFGKIYDPDGDHARNPSPGPIYGATSRDILGFAASLS